MLFKTGEELKAIQQAELKKTHITAWFKLNIDDDEAKEMYYADIPKKYIFNKKLK